ncbi:peroxidase family protein [Microvirga roseola]|uniref:peroxidase family protein n=1 Tax=Microvirga roseola TaxID=2883126 RepID=UPI001E611BBC|nr:heme peroxidase family protein [Microvirga roseola]
MTLLFQSHSGGEKAEVEEAGIEIPQKYLRSMRSSATAPPVGTDAAVDEQADFGYLVPPLDAPEKYLPETAEILGELDELGSLMVDAVGMNAQSDGGSPSDSTMPPILTYWGQFLGHELTARTERESAITSVVNAHPPVSSSTVETQLRNARSPRFDLDGVYGGSPIGAGITTDVVTVISGMRHPKHANKMRVGTATDPGPLPDDLDEHRDLSRYVQVQASVRDATLRLAQASMGEEEFKKFSSGLDQRALIGDFRNDENLVLAQFHVSVLRFHNKAVDFLASRKTGWLSDFASAQLLTRLHYQWLIVEGYLKGVCEPAVVNRVLQERASHFFRFRAEFDERRQNTRLGNALPLEFSVAAFRFGHSMVRALYDYNKNFGRSPDGVLPNTSLDTLFKFTGGGGSLAETKRLPKNWVVDWARFVGVAPHDGTDGQPARFARKIDTAIAPALGNMVHEGNEPDVGTKALFKHLARRNLRRGYNMRLATGQALHNYLRQRGALETDPISDVSALFAAKPALRDFLKNTQSGLHERTPLWFYLLAEAEASGGNRLGELGSWLVASTFVGVLLADPDSALSRGFVPCQSPLRAPDNGEIDSIARWMSFAGVMQ